MDTALASALASWLHNLPQWYVFGVPTLLILFVVVRAAAGYLLEQRLHRAEERMARSLQQYILAALEAEQRSQKQAA